MKRKRTPLHDRFWAKVDKNGPIPEHRPDLGPCWLWTAYVQKNGYAKYTVGERGHQKCYLAHRLSWELTYGEEPLPQLDHLCRNKPCVNPSHLEEVTHAENQRRSWEDPNRKPPPRDKTTHCANGHEFTPENTYYPPNGGPRQCRQCRAINCRNNYRRKHGIPLDDPIQPGKSRRTK